MVDIHRNPTKSELTKLLANGAVLRAVKDCQSGDIFLWNAEEALHNEFIEKLGAQAGTVDSVGQVFDRADKERIQKSQA